MPKVRKQFILDDRKVKKVRRALGVSTDTEAVDAALDIIIGNVEIANVHKSIAGKLKIRDMDQSRFHG